MKHVLKKLWRSWKWLLFLIAFVVAFWFGFVPFAKLVFVGKTLEVYNEAADKYSTDGDNSLEYQGVITDTLIRPSATVKGQEDTIVHRQSIQLAPKTQASDGKPRREDVGVFGDSAGLLNAFFSFLAFAAVLLTLYKQTEKDGHDKQNGARVLFEQEFFAMVGMLENIVAHLKFTDNKPVEDTKMINDIVSHYYQGMGIGLGKRDEDDEKLPEPIVVEGREVFKYIYSDRENYNLLQYVSKEKDLRQSAMAQEMCFDGTLDHYFRYLYRILKHIDESELLNRLDDPDKEREYYAHLLRAQLSNYELKMLFYNGLLGENPGTIKVLIEKYAMFNNLRAWELGKYQKVYYQAILDGESLYDPKDIDLQITYRVTAFWDEEKLQQLRKDVRNGNNSRISFLDRIKNRLVRKTESKASDGAETINVTTAVKEETVEPVVTDEKGASAPCNTMTKTEKKKDKTKSLKKKQHGRGKKKK